MEIEGAVAFVTGGSGGLGTTISKLLAEAGADVVVGYKANKDRAEETARTIEAFGRKAFLAQLDLSDPHSIQAAVARASSATGQLDILINNAGVASGGLSIPEGDLEALTPEIWDERMTVNVRGPFLMARSAAPHLRKSKWGRIVNIGSTVGNGTWGGAYFFAPSKAAVVPLTRFLAAALAPDVTVNCVAPGLMEGTPMTARASQSYIEGWKERSILRKTTSLEDVARQVITFCKSETITGQVLVIDGGIHFG